MTSNKTAWLDGAGKPLRIADSEIPKPGPDDIVVKYTTLERSHRMPLSS